MTSGDRPVCGRYNLYYCFPNAHFKITPLWHSIRLCFKRLRNCGGLYKLTSNMNYIKVNLCIWPVGWNAYLKKIDEYCFCVITQFNRTFDWFKLITGKRLKPLLKVSFSGLNKSSQRLILQHSLAIYLIKIIIGSTYFLVSTYEVGSGKNENIST